MERYQKVYVKMMELKTISESDEDAVSYREGVVDLFNILHFEAHLLYGGDLGCLTPREFQLTMEKRIPEGAYALKDLVRTFEAVNYGPWEPKREDFERCKAAVDLLISFMQDPYYSSRKPWNWVGNDLAVKKPNKFFPNHFVYGESRWGNYLKLLACTRTKLEFNSLIEDALDIVYSRICCAWSKARNIIKDVLHRFIISYVRSKLHFLGD